MRILMCGGGTEGHIAPSLALAEKMEKTGDDFLFVGRKHGEENKKILKAKYPYLPIDIHNLSTYAWYEKYKFLISLKNAIEESKNIIESFKPDAVFATGGYVSIAPVIVAHKKRIPIFLHESNAIAGSATKILLKYADTLFLGMPNCEGNFKKAKKIKYVGTPVREAFYKQNKAGARKRIGLKNEFMIFSFGGSLGASKLNQACLDVMKEYCEKNGIVHIHVTGKKYFEEAKEKYHNFVISDGYCKAVPFIDNIVDYLLSADVVISRSGAATISELLATGSYPVLVPSPNVKNNHQFFNAKAITSLAKTPLIEESDHLCEDLIYEIEYARNHPLVCTQKRQVLKSISTPDCVSNILEHLRKTTGNM